MRLRLTRFYARWYLALLFITVPGLVWTVVRARRNAAVSAALAGAAQRRRAGDESGAARILNEALASRPAAPLYAARAKLYLDSSRFEEAAVDAQKAADLDHDPDAYLILSQAESKLGQFQPALASLDLAFKAAREPSATLRLARGEARLRLAMLNESIEDMSQAIDQGLAGQDLDRALLMRGRAKLALGDTAGGLEDLNRLVGMEPQDPMGRLLRAQARLANKDYSGTVEDADAVLKQDPSNAAGFVLRAQARLELGKKGQAKADLRAAARISPGDPRIQQLLKDAGGSR